MDSPPRPFFKYAAPSTPLKPLRARPRTNNQVARTHSNCRRCLFGRPNHGEVTMWLQTELQTIYVEQQKKWNFDFATMKPLAGEWKWEKSSSQPSMKASSVSLPKGFPVGSGFPPKSPLEAQNANFLMPNAPSTSAIRPRNASDSHAPAVVASVESQDDDVFAQVATTHIPSTRDRIPSTTSSCSEEEDSQNEDPYHLASPRSSDTASFPPSSLPFHSLIATRGSMGRSSSESVDNENSVPCSTSPHLQPTLLASLSHTPSKWTIATACDAVTPTRSTATISSPPPRVTRASRKREASPSQTSLRDFFAVKRRSVEAGASSPAAAAKRRSAKRLTMLE